ncbi:hypothetical protein DY000_02032231 [Brassica cretica]|uniref:Uncharacterized protein n=1 Tax=Brassica cretica TaxID=69181 RepID=A0ABQ7DN70_BRACR|nr:hypothetical protein DY000_02032231 [Brassica cretica]
MVSQIVWLGVRDVFTQIAKDVVGQGLYHGTLTFKAKFTGVIHANMADSRSKRFSALGFSYTTNISYNVTYSLMKVESFLPEEDEAQEVKVAWSYSWSVTEVYFITIYSQNVFHRFYERILMTHSFLERIGQPEVDLATIGRKPSLCARCYIYSRVFFVTNVFDAFP